MEVLTRSLNSVLRTPPMSNGHFNLPFRGHEIISIHYSAMSHFLIFINVFSVFFDDIYIHGILHSRLTFSIISKAERLGTVCEREEKHAFSTGNMSSNEPI